MKMPLLWSTYCTLGAKSFELGAMTRFQALKQFIQLIMYRCPIFHVYAVGILLVTTFGVVQRFVMFVFHDKDLRMFSPKIETKCYDYSPGLFWK